MKYYILVSKGTGVLYTIEGAELSHKFTHRFNILRNVFNTLDEAKAFINYTITMTQQELTNEKQG